MDLTRAGYGEVTRRAYLGHVRRFANHHMRSPAEMGGAEVVQYLLHMVDNHYASLGNYRAARAALRALYRVSLQRPEQVENIPNRPDPLRQLVADGGPGVPVPHPPTAPHSEAAGAVATVL